MKTKLKALMGGGLLAIASLAVPQLVQAQPYGYGPGHGYGPGRGYGPGYGMGPLHLYHHPRADQIERRLYNLQVRVRAGARSGQLTPLEARRLMGQIRTVRHNLRVYMADGRLSNAEYNRLQREEAAVSHNVYVGRHNARRAY